jgi:hypothetical protein
MLTAMAARCSRRAKLGPAEVVLMSGFDWIDGRSLGVLQSRLTVA